MARGFGLKVQSLEVLFEGPAIAVVSAGLKAECSAIKVNVPATRALGLGLPAVAYGAEARAPCPLSHVPSPEP